MDRAHQLHLRLDHRAFLYFVFCPLFVSHGILYTDLPAYYSGAELAGMQQTYAAMFHAGWFVESMWSQTLVIHMIRTSKLPFLQSRASAPLTLLTLTGIAVLTVIPFTPLGAVLGFVALPAAYFAYLIPCILLYMVLATSLKKAYVRHYGELLWRQEECCVWSKLWMDLFGVTSFWGIDMGFWVALSAVLLLVIGMNVVFWSIKPQNPGQM